jgi:hypothetical protein
MRNATCIRVITEIEVNGVRATMLWLVATSDADEAVRAVRARVSAGCVVEATDYEFSPETVERLGLAAGQARAL